jgi:hypothetical protein
MRLARTRLICAVVPGLAAALLVGFSEVAVHLLHIDGPVPVGVVEAPLRSIEHLIGPRELTIYSPETTVTNGSPDWLETTLFWAWVVVLPFAFGACAGEGVRLAVSRVRATTYRST